MLPPPSDSPPSSTGSPSPPNSRISVIIRTVASPIDSSFSLAAVIESNSDRRNQMSSWASHICSDVIGRFRVALIVRSRGTVSRCTITFWSNGTAWFLYFLPTTGSSRVHSSSIASSYCSANARRYDSLSSGVR